MRLFLTGEDRTQELLKQRKIFLTTSGRPRPLKNLMVNHDSEIEPFTGFFGGNSLCPMGAFSYSMSGVLTGMRIGRYSSIGKNLAVPGTRHPHEWVTTSNITYERKNLLMATYLSDHPWIPSRSIAGFEKPLPVIGNDVWIAHNVTLNVGITIGDGSVVASNSVVTRDVPPYSIVGGNPARIIKSRFEPDVVESLLEIQWWDYEPAAFMHLDVTDTRAFVAGFERVKEVNEPFSPGNVTGAELLEMCKATA